MWAGFYGTGFNSVVSHHFQKLGFSRVASHGLGLVGRNGFFDSMLGEAFITLAHGLNHGHSICGLHVNVEKFVAYAILLSGEGDLFALGGGDYPIVIGVVADCESIHHQLEEREEIGDSVAD